MELALAILGIVLGAAALGLAYRAQGRAIRAEAAARAAEQEAQQAAAAADALEGSLTSARTELERFTRELAELRAVLEAPLPPLPKQTRPGRLDDLRQQLRAAAEQGDAPEEEA